MGGSSKKPKQDVTDYYLSMHYGICHGPVDEIKNLVLGEKSVWKGSVTDSSDIFVNRRNMLGGNKKEGGYEGLVSVLQGEPNQVLPPELSAKLGPTGRVPGFRGVLSLFFHGGLTVGRFARLRHGGFYWGSNSPYIRDLWVKLFRSPKGFYPAKALIERRPGDPDFDVNPAHMIYECSTNNEWGAGVPPSMIDMLSMQAAADKLYDEGFGLSMIWTGQQQIQVFIDIILNHIDATFEIDPRSGLYALNLVRDDYVVNDLPELTPDNFKLTNFSRRSWEETVNEINVTWLNPVNEEEENVTYHDLGNIAQQGGNIISETLDFTGIRTPELAMRVAQREGARRGAPLAGVEGVANRVAWGWMPGDVVLLTWPKLGIYRVPVRLGTVDRGSPGNPGIKITAVEDVFSLPTNSYARPPLTEWVDTSVEPFPLSLVHTVDVPFFMAAQDVGVEDAAAVEYPASATAVLAATPVTDAYGFELFYKGVDFVGDTTFLDIGSKSLTPHAKLPQAMVKEAVSVIGALDDVLGFADIDVGSILWVGTQGTDHELMLITDVGDTSGNLTLRRACLDTVARAWPANTPVWLYDASLDIEDDIERSEGEVINYRLLTATSKGRLPLADAPDVTHTVFSRMTRPYRPANVRIWDTLWPGVVAGYAPATMVKWSNRNRLLETDQLYAWTFGNIVPETDSTVTLQLLNSNNAVLNTFNGLTGTSKEVDLSGVTGPTASIVVWSERDGLQSYQKEKHTFDVAGYGMSYGNYYGGYGG